MNNQSHRYANDWLGANYGDQYKDKNQGQVNIPDWTQTGGDNWERGAEFLKKLTNDTGKLVIEFEPVQAKYLQVEIKPKKNLVVAHTDPITSENWFVNGVHKNSNAPGSNE